jgi:peptidoglycan-N-acetylglucosamine deacetylase
MSTPGRVILAVSTLAAPLLAGALACSTGPARWLALAVPAGYLAVLVAGVMIPRLAMFAPIVHQGPASRPELALTFDDGPDASSTRMILATLARFDAHATFFVLGAKARLAPELLAEIAAAGHDIGVHGETHDRLLSLRGPDAISASLEAAIATVEAATGMRPRLFRPPIGHVSPRTAAAARKLGLTLVAWSVRARDGLAATTAEQATRRVLAGLRPGAIVLMHDAAERGDREPVAVSALPAILQEIARRGLKCVPLSRMLDDGARSWV